MSRIVKVKFFQSNPFLRYSHVFKTGLYTRIPVKAYDYRLVYILEGRGSIRINNNYYAVSKSSLFIWRPGVLYSFHPDDSSVFTIIAFNFDFTQNNSKLDYPIAPDQTKHFNSDKITEIIDFEDINAFNEILQLNNMMHLEKSLQIINNEYNTRKLFYTLRIRSHFLLLLSEIANVTLNSGSSGRNRQMEIVDNVIKFIRENYNKNITNSEIAEHVNFNPAYINRLMVKNTGVSLKQYLIRHRISISLNLLQTTDLSINQITELSGFSDMNYFSRIFKKFTGVSPTGYRSVNIHSIK